MMSPRQRCQKFFLLLVSCVGISPEEDRRCSTVEISISLSENQGYQTSRRITQSLMNSTCTHKSKYLHPTWARGLSILLNLLLARIKSCIGKSINCKTKEK